MAECFESDPKGPGTAPLAGRLTPEYRELQYQFHKDKVSYGSGGHNWAPAVMFLCSELDTADVLDYGCGKATLNLHLPFGIQCYDPCIPKYASDPQPADIVVCTDVMEHIEEECVDEVLDHIQSLTLDTCILNVALQPAAKTMPDGRNAHITLKPPTWWLEKVGGRFEVKKVDSDDRALTVILKRKESANA